MLPEAEKALVAGGVPADAFDMHMRAGRFQDSLRLCERYHLSGLQQALTALVSCCCLCSLLPELKHIVLMSCAGAHPCLSRLSLP